MVPADLLDDVDLDGRVGTPGGHGHLEHVAGPGTRVADRLDQRHHPFGGERRPQQRVHAIGADPHGGGRRQLPVGGDRARVQLCAADLGQQLGEASGRQRSDLGVDATLEAQRRLGVQVQTGRRGCDGCGVPPRHLEHDVGGRRGDLGRCAAHDAGQADDLVVAVDDHPVLGAQRTLDAVQRSDHLTVERPPSAQMSARELRQVIGVVRLTELEHHVVGHVDDVVDRAHPGGDQALGEPCRRRTELHPRQLPHQEPPAQLGRLDVDRTGGRGRRRRRGRDRPPAGRTAPAGAPRGHERRRRC